MPKNKVTVASNQRASRTLKLAKKWLWCVIILLALFVRFWKIEYIPYANDADELAYIWAGQSLTDFGVPISWSSFAHTTTQWHWTEIPSENVVDTKIPIAKFVKPWFDHSFVLPLLMGSWSQLLGYHFPSIPPALLYRIPFLLIAGINLVLIYQIAKKTFGTWPALFSLSLISFSPTLLFAQRMVVSENLLATFMLLAIYFYMNEQPLWTLILASAFAGLVKLPGLCIVPVFGMAMLAEKKYNRVLTYGVGVTLIILLGYGLYGLSIDWASFLNAMRDQSSRLLGWSNPAFIFSQPGFHTKSVLDFSYYVILLLGLSIFFLPMNTNAKILAGATLATWLTIWVTSAEQDMLGWYKIPLFCVLAINAGGVFHWRAQSETTTAPTTAPSIVPTATSTVGAEIWRAPLLFVNVLLVVMVVNNLGLVRFPTQPLPGAQLLRVIVGGIFISGLLAMYWKISGRILIGACVFLISLYAVQSLSVADSYFAASCKDRNCPTPTVTFMQSVRTLLKPR